MLDATLDAIPLCSDALPDALGQLVSGARVVGLGEVSHGDHESFEAKVHIIEILIRRLGFSDVAIEREVFEMRDIDRYIETGAGDRATLLDLRVWPWVTEEMQLLIDTLRRCRQDGFPVRFLGFDAQYTRYARDFAQVLEARFPTLHAQVRPELESIGAGGGKELTPKMRRHASRRIAHLSQELQAHDRWLSAVAFALTSVLDREGIKLDPLGLKWMSHRDLTMAEIVARFGENSGNARTILWGHNGHIGRSVSAMTRPNRSITRTLGLRGFMGDWLSRRLGRSYVPITFHAGGGEYRAGTPENHRLRPRPVQPAEPASLEAELSAILEPSLIQLSPVQDHPLWRQRLKMRELGWLYTESQFRSDTSAPRLADALIWFPRVTPSRILADREFVLPDGYPPLREDQVS